MVERNVYALSFVSNSNEQIRINIPRADKTLSPSFVEQCMNNVIATGIVLTTNGRPIKIGGAELITTELQRVV
jgi:hypothetical protein